jgi:cytochrome b subunit of formate dehydrogenase
MHTDPQERETEVQAVGWVERYRRRARWFHAAVYFAVLPLLATGWWLLLGQEGNPSVLAWTTGIPDTSLHKMIGWGFVGVAFGGIALVGWKATATFVRESVRFKRSDALWFARWPAAVITGRFTRHEGHFDPGQRIANVVIVVGLIVLTTSGIGLVAVHGGPVFVWLLRAHVWATYAVTLMVVGHILIASGLLPGYRGAWRSMHLGGRLETRVAKRLWPAWFEHRNHEYRPDAATRHESRGGEGSRGTDP